MFPRRRNHTYEAGTTTFVIMDESRKEILGEGGKTRKIPVRLYYPAPKEAAGGKMAEYVSKRAAKEIGKILHAKNLQVSKESIRLFEDAPWAEGTFPLFLFSHGYNTYVESNTCLCAELAAAGYVVASVGHAMEAVFNEYADGSFDVYDKKINKIMYKNGFFRALHAQSKVMKMKGSEEEIEAAFQKFQKEHTPYMKERIGWWTRDMLKALGQIREDYRAHLDLRHGVAAGGHSFGGATAYNLCQTCEEICCGINMDGAVFGDYEGMVMKKPFLQLCCKENRNVELKPLFERKAPFYLASFAQMKHMGFTDIKFLLSKKMLVGTLDAEVLHENVTAFYVTFLEKYLKGKDVSIHKPVVPEIRWEEYR